MLRQLGFLGFFLLTVACARPASLAQNPTSAPAPATTPASTFAATRQAEVPTATPQAVAASGNVHVDIFAKSLQVPWAIERAADGRFFVTERPGRIRIIKNGQLQAEPWMTLPVTEIGEAGLLGLALDPQFNQNHFVYTAYTYRDGVRLVNRLMRLREDSNGKGVMDKVLVDGVAANIIHDGGRVKFGPDGRLYWTMGEENDRPVAQNVNALNGKILRLNSDGSIPSDNPFPNSYVYSYGHRNPQGLAWQPGTNRLYETEHGPSGAAPDCCRDEVNLIEPGKNYGWPEITGDQKRAGMVSPIIQSGNNTTWAPSGAAFVTQGPWAGSLLFTGLRGLSLYRLTLDKSDPRKVAGLERLFQNEYGRLRDVYEAPDGALYVLTNNRDGRGQPMGDDDRILKLTFK